MVRLSFAGCSVMAAAVSHQPQYMGGVDMGEKNCCACPPHKKSVLSYEDNPREWLKEWSVKETPPWWKTGHIDKQHCKARCVHVRLSACIEEQLQGSHEDGIAYESSQLIALLSQKDKLFVWPEEGKPDVHAHCCVCFSSGLKVVGKQLENMLGKHYCAVNCVPVILSSSSCSGDVDSFSQQQGGNQAFISKSSYQLVMLLTNRKKEWDEKAAERAEEAAALERKEKEEAAAAERKEKAEAAAAERKKNEEAAEVKRRKTAEALETNTQLAGWEATCGKDFQSTLCGMEVPDLIERFAEDKERSPLCVAAKCREMLTETCSGLGVDEEKAKKAEARCMEALSELFSGVGPTTEQGWAQEMPSTLEIESRPTTERKKGIEYKDGGNRMEKVAVKSVPAVVQFMAEVVVKAPLSCKERTEVGPDEQDDEHLFTRPIKIEYDFDETFEKFAKTLPGFESLGVFAGFAKSATEKIRGRSYVQPYTPTCMRE